MCEQSENHTVKSCNITQLIKQHTEKKKLETEVHIFILLTSTHHCSTLVLLSFPMVRKLTYIRNFDILLTVHLNIFILY